MRRLDQASDEMVEAGGFAIHVRHWPGAERADTRLVLLHEGLGCIEMWKDFPGLLAAASGCAVSAYSRPGYGRSQGHPPPWGADYMHREARDVLPDVLAGLAGERIVLVGHSDGASIATIYAGEHDDGRLAGLVLMAPHFFVEEVSLTSIAAARDAFVVEGLRQRLARYHADNVDDAFWGWNDAWLSAAFRDWNITDQLERVRRPVLVVQGRDDQYGTLAQVEAARRVLPPRSCRAEILDDCRHSPHVDRPDRTLAAIVDFVTSLAGVRGAGGRQ